MCIVWERQGLNPRISDHKVHVFKYCPIWHPLSLAIVTWLGFSSWVRNILLPDKFLFTTILGVSRELGSHLGSIKSFHTLKLFLLCRFFMPASPTHQNLLTLGCLSWTSWRNTTGQLPRTVPHTPVFPGEPQIVEYTPPCCLWSHSIERLPQTCFAPFHTPLSNSPRPELSQATVCLERCLHALFCNLLFLFLPWERTPANLRLVLKTAPSKFWVPHPHNEEAVRGKWGEVVPKEAICAFIQISLVFPCEIIGPPNTENFPLSSIKTSVSAFGILTTTIINETQVLDHS